MRTLRVDVDADPDPDAAAADADVDAAAGSGSGSALGGMAPLGSGIRRSRLPKPRPTSILGERRGRL